MSIRIKKGDILMFSRGIGRGPGLVRAGQRVLSIGRNLDSSVTHIGIVTKGNDVSSSTIGIPEVRVTHAVNAGVVTEALFNILRFTYQSAMIFRSNNPNEARAAAAVAALWGQQGSQGQKMQFAKRKAAMSVFGSAKYGSSAQQHAAEYAQYANTAGGPPSLHDPSNRSKAMFCSMFVVAVYQAALGAQAATRMNIDARNTSPMKLAAFLPAKGFTRIGNIFHMNGRITVVDHTGREIVNHGPAWAH